MGEQIVAICGNSPDQGKNKAEANPLVLPFIFTQIFRKIRVLYLHTAWENRLCSIMLGSQGDVKNLQNLTSFNWRCQTPEDCQQVPPEGYRAVETWTSQSLSCHYHSPRSRAELSWWSRILIQATIIPPSMAFAEVHTLTIIWLVRTQIYAAFDFQYTAKEASDTTLCASISFIHPQSDQNKNHKKVSVVKNIIKVINLYLNRPLRVFFPLMLRWKRQWTRPSCSLSALCNSVCVDPFWDLWGGGSWTGSKSSSRVPVS